MSRKNMFLLLIVVIVIFSTVIFFLYMNSKKTVPEIPEPTQQETIEHDLQTFEFKPENFQDPKIIQQDIGNYTVPENKKITGEDILNELNSPDVEVPNR